MKRPDPERVGVVALRVVRQLKRDRRTIGLILFAPIVLMILFGYALSGEMTGVKLGLVGVLMILFGYALSGEMTGVKLGLVDGGGHGSLRSYIASLNEFDILYLGSQSDAEKLILDGRLDGARGHPAGGGAGFAGCQQPADLGEDCGCRADRREQGVDPD